MAVKPTLDKTFLKALELLNSKESESEAQLEKMLQEHSGNRYVARSAARGTNAIKPQQQPLLQGSISLPDREKEEVAREALNFMTHASSSTNLTTKDPTTASSSSTVPPLATAGQLSAQQTTSQNPSPGRANNNNNNSKDNNGKDNNNNNNSNAAEKESSSDEEGPLFPKKRRKINNKDDDNEGAAKKGTKSKNENGKESKEADEKGKQELIDAISIRRNKQENIQKQLNKNFDKKNSRSLKSFQMME